APLWADAKTKIDALAAAGKIDGAAADERRAAARAALIEKFKPAYDALSSWVSADEAHADEVATGVWKLPDGPAFYAERLAAETTTDMTADQVHELGLREVERIKAEMDAIRERVGFKGSLREFFDFVRNDRRFYFSNDDEGRTAYLEESRKDLAAVREQPGAAQFYEQGTPDGSRPGVYYVHLIDMNAMPKPELESIAYHEGLPGHHLQISIAQELKGLPTFRTQGSYTA